MTTVWYRVSDLDRARSANAPPWNGIRGSVVDLLDVDLEHAALLTGGFADEYPGRD